MDKYYSLTKTLILSGIQCEKKLWFDLNDKIKLKDKAIFRSGNRFNDVVRKNYGEGLDLSDEKEHQIVIERTKEAIQSDNINVIYEAGFLFKKTFIRADVLIKKDNQWTMLEAKASTSVKDINISDLAIQSFIVKKLGLDVICNKIIHINKEFIYKGNENYKDLIVEVDITKEVLAEENEVENLIDKFLPLKKSNCPKKETGPHCKDPYPCHYLDRCSPPETNISNVSYKILPYCSKKIEAYCKTNKTDKLKDIPKDLLQSSRKGYAENYYQIIQEAHIKNTPWVNKDISEQFKKWKMPYYFMDFETIQQGVPIIENTKPFEQVPFQWSVHKLREKGKALKEFSFIDFDDQDIELNFLKRLIETLGDKGTIFVHNHPFEKGVLNKLKEKPKMKSYSDQVDSIIDRIEDTLELTRKNFYSPEMFGKYSLKKIIKGIPTQISYESEDEDAVSDGSDAQLAWFKCTDLKTKSWEKDNYKKELIKYCSKDTGAMYDLISYFLNLK
jgi:hypothetical protein